MKKSRGVSPLLAAFALVGLVGLGLAFLYVPSHTLPPNAYGMVEGVVSVGPSQPVCRVGESCNVNMTGYSLIFTWQCYGLCPALSRPVALGADGRYAVSLPVGTYTASLSSCPWLGCSSALPRTVTVDSGLTTTLNITIDTGIR
ncbi:MAG: hypothetical protein KGI38_02205 [Thaumarchaeota archaeon]|nr:hypothetical protein [Nitrososphaerota archaeon]